MMLATARTATITSMTIQWLLDLARSGCSGAAALADVSSMSPPCARFAAAENALQTRWKRAH